VVAASVVAKALAEPATAAKRTAEVCCTANHRLKVLSFPCLKVKVL
jgi:hypothetical protein